MENMWNDKEEKKFLVFCLFSSKILLFQLFII